MNFSVKLKINYYRPNENNEAALFFQVIINREKATIPIDLKWSIFHFDKVKECLLPRHANDADFHDFQLIIENKRNEIFEILKYHRIANKEITAGDVKSEVLNIKSRLDFISYFENKIQERFDRGLISEQTRKNNNSSQKMLKKFKNELLFKDLSTNTIIEYHAFLKRLVSPTGKSYRINTVAKFLTDMKGYLHYAKDEGILFDDPFVGKMIATNSGSIVYLNQQELKTLWDYYHSDSCTTVHKIILNPFLFACFTGLRHSDLERVTSKNIKTNNDLVFEPYKTRDLQKEVVVPLTQKALSLIDKKKPGPLFRVYSNQKANVRLKEIAEVCNIHKNLSTHVARHTFATQFLERGGKLEVLKELLGHSKIDTTMIYVHVTIEQKRNQIQLMNTLFD